MKQFVTIFPNLQNVHLIKDVGQIPYFFSQKGFNTKIVAVNSGQTFTHNQLNGEVAGLQIELLPNFTYKKAWHSPIANYLKQQAGNIAILNLYHLTIETFIYAIIYKKINPNGKIWLKSDIYNAHLQNHNYSNNKIKNVYYKLLEKKALQQIDIVSVENKAAISLFRKRFPYFKHQLLYVPNGVNDVFIKQHILPIKSFNEKENLIVVSGRIGAPEKNHELLLKVLPQINFNSWKVTFAGAIDSQFQPKINHFFDEFPHLQKNVIFTGELTDRKEIYNLYNRSKVLCLTSKEESYGIAFIEALYFGNYLIGTENMYAFDDFTKNERFGKKLPYNNKEKLKETLNDITTEKVNLTTLCNEIQVFAAKNYPWSNVLKPVFALLNDN